MGANPVKDSAHKNVLGSVGSHPKGTTKLVINRESKPSLFSSLDAYPFHAFSLEGQRNICKRHGITEDELEAVLLTYTRPGEPTEAERRAADFIRLLRVIEDAVAPISKSKGQPAKTQKGGGKC
jgi:hypothetical protein